MVRGTTPTHVFTLPIDTSLIKKIKIIYGQNDEIIFCKTNDDCVCKKNTIETTLTQEDTFKFDAKYKVQIQVRVLTTDGNVFSTLVRSVSVQKCLDNEVLT